MLFTRAALLLTLCGFVLAGEGHIKKKYNPQEIQSGIAFVRAGKLSLATGSWSLIVHLDTSILTEQVRTLRNITSQAMNTAIRISHAQNSANNSEVTSDIHNLTGRFFKVEFESFEHAIDDLEEELATIKSIGRARKRRSVAPFVGRGLKTLFGVATEEDVEKLIQMANTANFQHVQIAHSQQLQLTLFRALTKEEKKQNKILKVLVEHASSMDEELQRASDTLGQLPGFVMLTNKLAFLSRFILSHLGSCRHTISKLGRIATSLAGGKLAPGLMPNKKVRHVLSEVEDNLPSGWRLAIPIKDSTWHYYESLAVSAIPTQRGWLVHIPIPIQLDAVGTFQLYVGRPFPLVNPNTNTTIVIDMPSKYLAVSKDNQYITLDDDDLQDCLHFDRAFVCSQMAISQENSDGCMWNAFHGNLEKMDTECKRRILTGKPVPMHLHDEKWSYAFWNATKMQMNCSSPETSEEITLTGNGVLHIPDRCWVRGDSFTLLGSLHGTKRIEVAVEAENVSSEATKIITEVLNITHWVRSLAESKHTKLLGMLRDDVQTLLETDNDVDVALDDLKAARETREISEMCTTTTSDVVMDALQLSLASLALLLVIILLVYKMCGGKCKT